MAKRDEGNLRACKWVMAADATTSADALIAHLRSLGPMQKAYPAIRLELPKMLSRAADGHQLILDAVSKLLDDRTESKSQPLCALLLEAAHNLKAPSPAHTRLVSQLCARYPHFVRKLIQYYGKFAWEDGASSEAVALSAAQELWSKGKSNAAEVAMLIAEYGLHAEFKVKQVLRAALKSSHHQAVIRLAQTDRSTALALLEELVATSKAKEAVKMLHKLGLRVRDVPQELLCRLRVGFLSPRLSWLAHSHHWDLIDHEYEVISQAVKAVPRPMSPPGLDAPIDEAAFAEQLVHDTQLTRAQWVELAAALTERLCGSGYRSAAVHGCVRHGLEDELKGYLGKVSEAERAVALSESEEEVATGVHHAAAAEAAVAAAAASGSAPSYQRKPKPAGPFYELDVPLSRIQVVADGAGASSMCEAVLAEGGVLGIDCEWRGDGAAGALDSSTMEVQLVQLSTGTQIYLLDLPALLLGPAEHAQSLQAALQAMMGCATLLKLGFGLKQDLAKLRQCHPALAPCAASAVTPMVELSDVYCARHKKKSSNPPSLSSLVAETLGRPLDKAMQMSNWTRRPLCRSQLVYGALDAHCLVRIFANWERRRLALGEAPLTAACVPPQPRAAGGGDRGEDARRRFLCCCPLVETASASGDRVALRLAFGRSFAARQM